MKNNAILNLEYMGLPLPQHKDSINKPNLYKEKILELEDKLFKIEQSMTNFCSIKKVLESLAKSIYLDLNVDSEPEDNSLRTGKHLPSLSEKLIHLKICFDSLINSSLQISKRLVEQKVKSPKLRKILRVNKVMSLLEQGDPLFILNKLAKFETQFAQFNFLNKQKNLLVDEKEFKYSCLTDKGSICMDELYKQLRVKVDQHLNVEMLECGMGGSVGNGFNSGMRVFLLFSKKQFVWLEDYVKDNLYVISQRMINLEQLRRFRVKEKNRISLIANEFFYDQKLVNKLTNNYEKIEELEIYSILNCLGPCYGTSLDSLPSLKLANNEGKFSGYYL